MIEFDLALDLLPMLAGTLAAVGCALLGNFLVLRRLSLMGDAISHSVLPGLVIAFLIASTRSPMVMFAGAAIAGVATVILVELVRTLGRVEPGAAMGVVFSVLFALGVLLIERAAVRHVDLDAECVLHGQLELLIWYGAPSSLGAWLQWDTLRAVPPDIVRQLGVLSGMVLGAILFVSLFFKELRLAAFDPALATAQGFSATLLHFMLMIFVAAATVASFEVVGSILVIAMLICPAATARLLTDRLPAQLVVSVIVAISAAVGGYLAAISVPAWFDRDAVNAAGAMAMMAGVLLTIALFAAPRHGVIMRRIRQRRVGAIVARDNLLAALYRSAEAGVEAVTTHTLRPVLAGASVERTLAAAERTGAIERDGATVRLTERGRRRAAHVIRRHRLWEHYLVEHAGLAPDHVHDTAEQLEHLSISPTTGPGEDPHGRAIPEREES